MTIEFVNNKSSQHLLYRPLGPPRYFYSISWKVCADTHCNLRRAISKKKLQSSVSRQSERDLMIFPSGFALADTATNIVAAPSEPVAVQDNNLYYNNYAEDPYSQGYYDYSADQSFFAPQQTETDR